MYIKPSPSNDKLIDWSYELSDLTEQKLELIKRENDLADREAMAMQQELKLRDMADKQQLESTVIMKQIEVQIRLKIIFLIYYYTVLILWLYY
jgi:hypothetical protein